MKNYHVYMLECVDGSIYTGVTGNIERRIAEHSMGLDPFCYTYSRRPVSLIWTATYYDVVEAIECEKKLKRWSHDKKMALASGDWGAIKMLGRKKWKTLCQPE
ncbi:MAG: GIY-YIG nuclease family protein [Candidatus Eremiobacteraeota bacterium]|nr:GIY-YIG nuclease family protein [Candidatus Eremiobacteraeota bacterium]